VAKQLLLRPFSLTILMLAFCFGLSAQINFSTQSQYKFIKGSNATTLESNWMDPGFNDSGWQTGNSPFRYGDGSSGTVLSDMINNYSTVYLRTTFNASQKELLGDIQFTVNYDDGFVLWINGSEAYRLNAPDVLSYNAFAPLAGGHESGTPEIYTIHLSDLNLNEGINTLAVQGFNVSLGSTDFFFDMSLSASTGTPELKDTVGITFSKNSGLYNSVFNLTMTSPNPTAHILYTLDGSNPQNSSTAVIAGTTATVSINPASSNHRGITPGVVVRASITKTGYKPSKPNARTYIFIEKVKTQGNPGGDWPSGDVNGQKIDFPIDATIINDNRYSALIDDALLEIPTISVITDNKNLFDATTGIYVNAFGHGFDWEKECSVELINPDGSAGFNVNAGLRIRGGWSRHPEFPKHAFRLFFREAYGEPKLSFPLFGAEGAQEFDKIDLRAEQNYSWSNGDSRNTMVREIFSRDSQRDMGQPYSRSRYYHLYLNGLYFGIYQTQERSEARFASEYLGGNDTDYDVIKVNTENWSYQIEATDGNTDGWLKLYNACFTDLSDNTNYFKLLGCDADGKRVKDAEVLIDIDNLIDYMLVIFYTGNFDSPTSSFGNNKGPNNFFAIDNREDKTTGFKFFAHDSEHSMFSDAASPGTGLYENRVNIGDLSADNGMKMEVYGFGSFHPQWLHYKLTQNAEYRIRFADRAYKYLQGDGALTPAKCLERLNKRISEIDTAVIAESARWGDANGWSHFTKDDNWIPEINKIKSSFINARTNILITQLKQADLYTTLNPPTVKKSGTVINNSKYIISSSFDILLDNPNTSGKIYYTLDGSDPRIIGDNISSSAIGVDESLNLNISSSTILKARIYKNGEWSALKHIDFVLANEDYSKLKVTELSYHPRDIIHGTDTIYGDDLEFIEFKNIGESSINLSGLVIDSAIYYEFPNDILLAPKQFWVVASKPANFFEFYGLEASGNFSGNLSNSGEEILVHDAKDNSVINFIYDDGNFWPTAPDGDGYTLVSSYFNPTGNPMDEAYWRTSLRLNGSPFHDDDGTVDIKTPEILTDVNILIYPNPTSGNLSINIKGINEAQKIDVKIYNINGSLLYQKYILNNEKIDLKTIDLDYGLYFIKIETDNLSVTSKIIFTD
jgi:hypothetical protein